MFRWVVSALLLSTLAAAQNPGATVGTPRPEHGVIVSNMYANEFFGLWFPIPQGWQVSRDGAGQEVEAKRLSTGGLELLILDRATEKPRRNRIVLSVQDASGMPPSTETCVSQFVRTTIAESAGGKALGEAVPVEFGAKQFFRADYMQGSEGNLQWGAFVGTKLNGYLLGWTFVAGSQRELEEAANTLRRLSFTQIVGGPIIGGIISGSPRRTPGVPLKLPQKIRVSRQVSEGLLITRRQPEYPEEARRKHVERAVVLQGFISKNGDVAQLSVVSGDPLLVPAALNAVWQWKYKPYLLEGQPVAMETLIKVEFEPAAQ